METYIAYHCGPALAGMKPANLVACYKRDYPNVHRELEQFNNCLGRSGIVLQPLCECEKRVLLLAYREQVLYTHVLQPEIQAFLYAFGYPADGTLDQYLAVLKLRLQCNDKEFPHEIGAFLGYPVYDIESFIACRGKGYLFSGEWKVYHNERAAKETFSKYQACRQAILKKMKEGATLIQLFCTV